MFGFNKETKDDGSICASDLYAKQAREAKKKHKEEVDSLTAKLFAQDEKDLINAREFRPDVTLREYKAGVFFCYGDFEVPIRFIENIKVLSPGEDPATTIILGELYGVSARIGLTMSSGKTNEIVCTRFEVDILYDALVSAWKGK